MEGRTLSHYRILEKIGAGGMGIVYRAHDERLDRDVALKVLPGGLLSDEGARRRFRREALALSRLSHPNIETVYDFDTQEAVDFLVMEYIPGETLAQKLAGGPLPEKEVAALGAQIASALEGAHERGVVHRDLKPGNIMVTSRGQVKVLDFGLAMLLRPEGEASQVETKSQAHAAVGTLPYMAPEQLRGEKVDARSDIYAAGAVLFEMATRQRPFPQESAPQLIDAIQHEAPPTPSAINRRLSPALDHIILKALDKDPRRRYQSARDLLVDLERLGAPAPRRVASRPRTRALYWALAAAGALLALVAVIIGLNVGGMRDRLLGRAAPGRIESLAVLPLANLSGNPEQEYFADGMTEELITDLAKIGALRVISRTSAMHFKGTDKPVPEIARQLNVDAIIEGSVMRSGNRVRITAQLVEGATDRHLWAESYERDLKDILALQHEVARAIARQIEVKLTPRELVRFETARAVDPEAYDAYLKGRYYWNKRTKEGISKGLESFQQAVARDPSYALAHAGVADAYSLLARWGFMPGNKAFPQAKAAAVRAVQLDDDLAEAHTALAAIKHYYDLDWPGAEEEYKRAIALNPNYPLAHDWYAILLTLRGRFEEAIAQVRWSQRLDPLSLISSSQAGWVFYFARQYDRAIEACRKGLELDPNHVPSHLWLGWGYEGKGMYPEAIAEYQKAMALSPGATAFKSYLGHAYAVSGHRKEAEQVLDELKARSGRDYFFPARLAAIDVALGNNDEAFTLLDQALEEHDITVTYIKVEPEFDPVRSDPRFQDLLRRVGLSDD
jgi:TolB-like protein/Flp pilus assembly protein TadD